ncbi:a-factor receptor [Teratosphaeriaceae sp. CCFEE 6253]|nr:a-factor receptor [Teratosphaeriaceae sp. CCFEE 6253]
MAPLPDLQTLTPPTTSPPATTPYPAAILLAAFSLLVVLLLTSPLCWHYRNRNVGATMLVAWTIIINLQSFTNALLWPNDDIAHWYNGRGLCDVEVKLQVAWFVAAPAALAAVLRALANAIDTNRATLVKSKAQRVRDYAIDFSLCLGLPALTMLFHYIVQPTRYVLFGITGCLAASSKTWLTVVLLDIPPGILTLVDTYYAILILVRLCRYRATMSSILASSNMSKNRFLRLYSFCIVFLIAFVPLQAFVLAQNLRQGRMSFSWSEVHDPANWNLIIMVPSEGRILYQVYIWLGGGMFIFVFFGMGRDAMAMYRAGLLAMGFDRVFPSLKPGYTPRHSVSGTISSLGSKAKLVFKRKTFTPLWRTSSSGSQWTSMSDDGSRKEATLLETIDEHRPTHDHQLPVSAKREKPPLVDRLFSVFKSKKGSAAHQELALADVGGSRSAVHSDVTASDASTDSMEVIVRKEVRQASETA